MSGPLRQPTRLFIESLRHRNSFLSRGVRSVRRGACLGGGTTGDGFFAGLAPTAEFANTYSEHTAATKLSVFVTRGFGSMGLGPKNVLTTARICRVSHPVNINRFETSHRRDFLLEKLAKSRLTSQFEGVKPVGRMVYGQIPVPPSFQPPTKEFIFVRKH